MSIENSVLVTTLLQTLLKCQSYVIIALCTEHIHLPVINTKL